MAEDWQQGGFGIYVHWPFCASKCPYCDFNSHVAKEIDESRWVRAYLDEIDRYAEALPGRVVNSIFFGGGTPSLMAAETVGAIIERIRDRWMPANDIEITLEANPGSVEAGRFRGYADGGVNRVSLGVQALNDADLRALGRLHDVAEALQALEIARNIFDRMSFDLIYARQNQTLHDWTAELRQALTLAGDHLSLYQLTIEPGTAFGNRYKAGKLPGLPPDDLAADMYEATQDICGAAGFEAYEVSNHAKTGSQSRHNMIYWRYGDYIGIGPGAHGRITLSGKKLATETELNPNAWLAASESGRSENLRRELSGPEQAEEYLMMGLRISQGIDLKRYSEISGVSLDPGKIAHLSEVGMVVQSNDTLRVTPAGRLVLNAVIKELFAD